MHELGILYEAVQMADQAAKDNGVKKVSALQLEVGELSGCVPRFFEMYYPMVIEDFPTMKESRLMIDIVKGEGLCNECGALYNVMRNEGKCPACGSRDKKIISGRDFMVKNILVEE